MCKVKSCATRGGDEIARSRAILRGCLPLNCDAEEEIGLASDCGVNERDSDAERALTDALLAAGGREEAVGDTPGEPIEEVALRTPSNEMGGTIGFLLLLLLLLLLSLRLFVLSDAIL